MSDKILVTYASRTGSTAEIAKVIANTLVEHDFQVDVYPMSEVTDLGSYSAVVAGSAIHDGKWLPEALQFVEMYQAQLRQKPFAAFLVCMTLALNNEQWLEQAHVENWLAPVRALVNPVSEGLFAGTLDISKIPSFGDRLKFRVSILSGVWSEGDHRDWDAIQNWADQLPAKFSLGQSTFKA